MNQAVVLWILGAFISVLGIVVGYLASRINELTRAQATLAQHVAENYVRGHEIVEVKRAVESLRLELTHKVDELLKAVHELIGKQSH